jgi:hypothetical protein
VASSGGVICGPSAAEQAVKAAETPAAFYMKQQARRVAALFQLTERC